MLHFQVNNVTLKTQCRSASLCGRELITSTWWQRSALRNTIWRYACYYANQPCAHECMLPSWNKQACWSPQLYVSSLDTLCCAVMKAIVYHGSVALRCLATAHAGETHATLANRATRTTHSTVVRLVDYHHGGHQTLLIKTTTTAHNIA